MPLSRRHADRHVAEHAGERDQPEDRHDPAERAPDEDQQGEAADGVERHPLAREGEAEQDADDRHRHPERPSARHQPVQSAANTVYAATMNRPT